METPTKSPRNALQDFRSVGGNKVAAVTPDWNACAIRRHESQRHSFVSECEAYFNGNYFKAVHVVKLQNRKAILEKLSQQDRCKNLIGGNELQCNCLQILKNNRALCFRVATIGGQMEAMRFCLYKGAPWTQQDIQDHQFKLLRQQDIDSETDISLNHSHNPVKDKRRFTTIRAIIKSDRKFDECMLLPEFQNHAICSSAFMTTFGLKKSEWRHISRMLIAEKKSTPNKTGIYTVVEQVPRVVTSEKKIKGGKSNSMQNIAKKKENSVVGCLEIEMDKEK